MELNKKYFNQRKWHSNELPDIIAIESVMGCNLRCEMCPVPQSKLLMNGRTTTTMSLETYSRILDEISDKPRSIGLMLNLELNGLFFSDYLGQACFFPRCLDRAGQPGSVFSG